MAMRSQRGTKRTCLNETCGARFYDIMRDPIKCPICDTVHQPQPTPTSRPKSTWKTKRTEINRSAVELVPVVAVESKAANENLDEPTVIEDTEAKITSDKPDPILATDEEEGDEVNVVEIPVAADESG